MAEIKASGMKGWYLRSYIGGGGRAIFVLARGRRYNVFMRYLQEESRGVFTLGTLIVGCCSSRIILFHDQF